MLDPITLATIDTFFSFLGSLLFGGLVGLFAWSVFQLVCKLIGLCLAVVQRRRTVAGNAAETTQVAPPCADAVAVVEAGTQNTLPLRRRGLTTEEKLQLVQQYKSRPRHVTETTETAEAAPEGGVTWVPLSPESRALLLQGLEDARAGRFVPLPTEADIAAQLADLEALSRRIDSKLDLLLARLGEP